MDYKRLNNAKDLWRVTHNWLSILGNKVSEKYCRDEITNHPDYPAITAVTDFLEAGNMMYHAVVADKAFIEKFNYPLLAHIRIPDQEFLHTLLNPSDWNSQDEIMRHWTGIVIFPEKKSAWHSEENSESLNSELKQRLYVIGVLLTGFSLLIVTMFSPLSTVLHYWGILSLLGLITSFFLIAHEVGYNNSIVKQICGISKENSCNNVMNSKYAKLAPGVTTSDISLIYFASQFIVYLIGNLNPVFLHGADVLSLAGIAVCAWSIYIQIFMLRQYCPLCLSIVLVLLLQAAAAIFLIYNHLAFLPSMQSVISYIAIFSIITFIQLPVKYLITADIKNRVKLVELKNWKADLDLFLSQWRNEQLADTTIWENELLLGASGSKTIITVACNPYCAPCAKMHAELDSLLNKFHSQVSIQIRLVCDESDDTDKKTIAVKSILKNAAGVLNNIQLQEMLSDWFRWMDLDKWSSKWHLESDIKVEERLKQHNNWVFQHNILFTPTVFINGRKLPGRYNIKDIERLLPQLSALGKAELL